MTQATRHVVTTERLIQSSLTRLALFRRSQPGLKGRAKITPPLRGAAPSLCVSVPRWDTFKHMPQFILGNVDIHYEVYGNGDPLVLIPGFAAGAWIWFKQVASLATKFKVVTFDPRGIGQSSFDSEPLTMRSLADDAAALLHGLGIEQAHILGVSFGGFVAQEFALAYPEATRTLLFCCTSFGGPNHVSPSIDVLTADEVIKLRLANPVVEEAFNAQLKAGIGFDAESRVNAIKAPTLVLSGDADRIVPAQNSRNLAERIPGARLRLVEGGSHLFFIEQPDEFNRTVVEFLTQN